MSPARRFSPAGRGTMPVVGCGGSPSRGAVSAKLAGGVLRALYSEECLGEAGCERLALAGGREKCFRSLRAPQPARAPFAGIS
jgi:hypothetical protein